MTNKIEAWMAAVGLSLMGFWNWLVTVPPEQQEGWLAQLVELTPLDWRPNVGLFTRLVMLALTVFAFKKASQSGPATPPQNPVNE